MREILFKGKTYENNWVEGNLIITGDECYILSQKSECIIKNVHIYGHWYINKSCTKVIPETVCQLTGLTDKNGVKIFSDDLLKDKQGTIFRIYQIAGGFCAKASVWKSDIKDWVDLDLLISTPLTEAQMQSYIAESCEVIVNIHEK